MRAGDVDHHVIARICILRFGAKLALKQVDAGEEDLAGYGIDGLLRLTRADHAEHGAHFGGEEDARKQHTREHAHGKVVRRDHDHHR